MKDLEYDFSHMIEEDNYKLIENLIKIRKSKNITQKDISNITGMSQQAVSRIEKYGHCPSLINFLKYIRVLGININDILISNLNIL